jgi:hypothetical protein
MLSLSKHDTIPPSPLGNQLSVQLSDVNLIVFDIDDVSMHNAQGNTSG